MQYSYDITILLVFQFLLIFIRVGSACMMMSGVGEIYVSPRIRLILALLMSLLLQPTLASVLPSMPTSVIALTLLIAAEIVTGLFLGMLSRIMQAALHVGGMMIAFQSSLASAIIFDPSQGSQGSVVGNFMTLIGITLIFVTNTHHLLLEGMAGSYTIFSAGFFADTGELADITAHMVSEAFMVGVKLAAPMIVVSVVMYVGLGIMSRLMPSMQVFFIVVPLQLLLSFAVIAMTLSFSMLWYIDYYRTAYTNTFTIE